uniref:Glutamate/phenylalanine/leucine/valine/L-tryptophan dehydrogenase C-terminal domain-containing protein n=1 Tax=Ditylum brightwellii TaxID=49249 RepID=A0A7S4QI86_9STRA
MDMHLNLQSHLPDGRSVLTFIRPGTQPGLLLKMVKELPYKHVDQNYLPLSRVQVFSSEDESMSLNMFVYGEEAAGTFDVEVTGARILQYAKDLMEGEYEGSVDGRHPKPSPLFERENLLNYLNKCSESYITRSDPRRFLCQMQLFDGISGTEGTRVAVEESYLDGNDEQFWVDIAVANSLPQVALEQASRLLFLHKFDVQRCHLDTVSDGENGNVTHLRLLVTPIDHGVATKEFFSRLKRELRRSKWLDPSTMDLVFERYPWLGVRRGEIITAFCSLMHPIMAKVSPLAYSKVNILETITKKRYIDHAALIANLFLDKFDPEKLINGEEFVKRKEDLIKAIDSDVEDTTASELLYKMIDIVEHTLRTNIYLYDRYSLGLRLDPRVMVSEGEGERELPYGVLFAHGRRFNAYHVRFRDISRGGMRLVTPSSPEQYALESAHHYDECYGLAFAQQLKNKDIPEGGSKAVNLINVHGLSDVGKNFVMRKSVKAFTDTILDLVVDTEETREKVVDYLGKKEILYLGPDEQVTPGDINWIIRRAEYRGYDTPAAFMSSKPRAGINHKEFGVTSEGVNVYLDVAIRHVLGIDPTKQSFTVKMTGGPDGDVAGNEIKILIREYGENVKIVGIADHSGCAEDPNGLDHEELLRLVNSEMSISNFDKSKLGADGAVHHVNTEEGVKARNSMHNRLEADAFVPAGGRPNTIDIHNYKHFLRDDGSPSSPLIIEGANLFVTNEARQALFDEANVIIVKDSSANKGGVITSSYEICAAMMLTEEEFFQNKAAIVQEVLSKVRDLAKMEATLLFREFENYGGSLPLVSQVISNTINVATDALSVALDNLSKEDRAELLPLFRDHLPKTLAALSFDNVNERVPDQYIKNAIASCLASKLVYKEGTKFIEAQPKEKLANIALQYVLKEKEVAMLKEALASVNMPQQEKDSIIKLLDAGGARTALGKF